METVKLLWFFVWRMAALAFGLGAVVGAIYGEMILMSVTVSSILMDATGSADSGYLLFVAVSTGLVYGLIGAVAGLALGMICGLLLFRQADVFYRSPLRNPDCYRRAAGHACAVAGGLIVLASWLVWLVYQAALHGGSATLGPFEHAVETIVLVVVPALLSAAIMWFSGKKVAGQYARKAGGSEIASDSAAESMPED